MKNGENLTKKLEHGPCTTRNRPYLIGKNDVIKRAVIFQPRCKLWSCPSCAEVNKALWGTRAYQGAQKIMSEGQTLYFLTLTSHEKLTPDQSLWVWPKAWSKLRDRMKYAVGGTFSYLMVPERHESGKLHVHAIESAGLGKTWIKKNARVSGLGYIDDEEKLRTPTGAAWYTTKYLTKSLEFTAWPVGFRRVRTSQNWPKLAVPDAVPDWEFSALEAELGLDQKIESLENIGYNVYVMDHLTAWEMVNHPFGGGDGGGEVE